MLRKKVEIGGCEYKLTAFTVDGFRQEGGPLSAQVYRHEAVCEVRVGGVLETRIGVYRKDGDTLARIAPKAHEAWPGAEVLGAVIETMIEEENERWTKLYELVQSGELNPSLLSKATRARNVFAGLGLYSHKSYVSLRDQVDTNDRDLDQALAALAA